jgi:hypothetical protein
VPSIEDKRRFAAQADAKTESMQTNLADAQSSLRRALAGFHLALTHEGITAELTAEVNVRLAHAETMMRQLNDVRGDLNNLRGALAAWDQDLEDAQDQE